MKNVLNISLTGLLFAALTCFVNVKSMNPHACSNEVPAYHVILKAPGSKDWEHLMSLRYVDNKTLTCTQKDLQELKELNHFLKTTDVYVPAHDCETVKSFKGYVKRLEDSGYETIYNFKTRPHKSKL